MSKEQLPASNPATANAVRIEEKAGTPGHLGMSREQAEAHLKSLGVLPPKDGSRFGTYTKPDKIKAPPPIMTRPAGATK